METALISTEHLWYTVALGNCFHIDAESEPLRWGYSDYLGIMGHLLHGNAHGKKKGEENSPREREVYPPFTITLIMRKSISPLAMRRPSHVYGPSSVFFMPRIWRWLLLSSLNRTKEVRGQTLREVCWTQDENLVTINERQCFKKYFCTFGDENIIVLQTSLVYGRQKWQHDANNDKSFPFCHHMKRACNISVAPNMNMVAVSKSSLNFTRGGHDFNSVVI